MCLGIRLIENKGIFLIGGVSKEIRIYRKNNYECIQIIKDAHSENIKGFIELIDCSIVSYSDDNTIKIWRIET
jgi:WD40 repeat protein